MCETGAARSMCPIRSPRTFWPVPSPPQRPRLVGALAVLELPERPVGRPRQVGAGRGRPRLALFPVLGGRLAADGAERAGREVDSELLRRAEQLVLLLPHLDLAALVREDVD